MEYDLSNCDDNGRKMFFMRVSFVFYKVFEHSYITGNSLLFKQIGYYDMNYNKFLTFETITSMQRA